MINVSSYSVNFTFKSQQNVWALFIASAPEVIHLFSEGDLCQPELLVFN